MTRASIWIVVFGCVSAIVLRAAEPPVAPKETKAGQADSTAKPTSKATGESADEQDAPRELFTGQVVMLREALKRRKIPSRDEFDKQVVLETPQGELIPIVPDWRGRAFYQDEKLRNRKVELVGVRRPGIPYVQVLMVFTFDEKGARQYTDYWCDICSIPMYEIKQCDCCQGPVRLRFQPRDLPEYVKKKP
jgi:hypothetical protein